VSGTLPANEPACIDGASAGIELLIESRPRDLGGFAVRRALPSVRRRLVGPFVFFDHMGPADLSPGAGIDVRPHPHIGLATVTYLFDGEIDHRDSLGSAQTIRPGDVNWMLAGRGIAHSERSSPGARARGGRVHGIQSWVALPLERELAEPSFEHHPSTAIPRVAAGGATLEVIAGEAYGERSPVGVLSPTLYVHARMSAGARVPIEDRYEERAIYVVEGTVRCEVSSFARGADATRPSSAPSSKPFAAGTMAVLHPGATVAVVAEAAARVMLLGGATLAGDRHVYWNFVSSSKERIEQAKDDWVKGRFPKVPGDDVEFIPLPEQLTPSHTTA
jgi:redox-sensitive bicupin YhaK (pirin superfamily)